MTDIAQLILAHGLLAFLFGAETAKAIVDRKPLLSAMMGVCLFIWLQAMCSDIVRAAGG